MSESFPDISLANMCRKMPFSGLLLLMCSCWIGLGFCERESRSHQGIHKISGGFGLVGHFSAHCRPLLPLHPEPSDTNEAIETNVEDISPGGTVSGRRLRVVGGPKAKATILTFLALAPHPRDRPQQASAARCTAI